MEHSGETHLHSNIRVYRYVSALPTDLSGNKFRIGEIGKSDTLNTNKLVPRSINQYSKVTRYDEIQPQLDFGRSKWTSVILPSQMH